MTYEAGVASVGVMNTTTTTDRPTHTRPTSRGRIEIAASVWSFLAAVVGTWWLAVPDAYPDHLDRTGSDGSLVGLLDPTVVSSMLVAFGVVGALATAIDTGLQRRWLVPLGAA